MDHLVSRFDRAVMLLPPNLKEQIRHLSKNERALAEEIRLRWGRCPTVLINGIEIPFSQEKIGKNDMEMVIDIATGASGHAAQNSMKNGFITAPGGYRIGIGGQVYLKDGEIAGFGNITSLAVRISRELLGIGEELVPTITKGGFRSTLIVSPPGYGKTTLLRDLVRIISDHGTAISLVDERQEIAGFSNGQPQFDVGAATDILSSCPKAKGISMAARALSPKIIAIDEITEEDDVKAIIRSYGMGIEFIATAHGKNMEDLRARPIYRALLQENVFKNIVFIEKQGNKRIYITERSEKIK